MVSGFAKVELRSLGTLEEHWAKAKEINVDGATFRNGGNLPPDASVQAALDEADERVDEPA